MQSCQNSSDNTLTTYEGDDRTQRDDVGKRVLLTLISDGGFRRRRNDGNRPIAAKRQKWTGRGEVKKDGRHGGETIAILPRRQRGGRGS